MNENLNVGIVRGADVTVNTTVISNHLDEIAMNLTAAFNFPLVTSGSIPLPKVNSFLQENDHIEFDLISRNSIICPLS